MATSSPPRAGTLRAHLRWGRLPAHLGWGPFSRASLGTGLESVTTKPPPLGGGSVHLHRNDLGYWDLRPVARRLAVHIRSLRGRADARGDRLARRRGPRAGASGRSIPPGSGPGTAAGNRTARPGR